MGPQGPTLDLCPFLLGNSWKPRLFESLFRDRHADRIHARRSVGVGGRPCESAGGLNGVRRAVIPDEAHGMAVQVPTSEKLTVTLAEVPLASGPTGPVMDVMTGATLLTVTVWFAAAEPPLLSASDTLIVLTSEAVAVGPSSR